MNTWHAPRGTLTTAAAISFDGQGYLWVEQFGSVPNFNANARTMRIITRPNDERDGLVLYAYDKMVSLVYSQCNMIHVTYKYMKSIHVEFQQRL